MNTTDENVTISASDGIVNIDKYMSSAGSPGAGVFLNPGLRQYNIVGYASSVAQPSYFIINVSKYNTIYGNETFLYNISSVKISSTVPTTDITQYVSQKGATYTAHDRLLIRISAYTTRLTPTTIHFINQGFTPTYVQSGFFDCPETEVYCCAQETPIPIYLPIVCFVLVMFIYHKKSKR